MKSARDENIAMLALAARHLGPLLDQVAFVGGCAVAFLLTDEAAPDIRPTRDVDVIVHVVSRSEYYSLEEKLRKLGFRQPCQEGDPICRWEAGGVTIDFMPTDRSILGFSNRWSGEALENAVEVQLETDLRVRMISAPYFVAMKLEAFRNRGEGDYRASPDLEDIIAIVDGRPELLDEVRQSANEVRAYLSSNVGELLGSPEFLEALPGHLPSDASSQARLPLVAKRLVELSDIDV